MIVGVINVMIVASCANLNKIKEYPEPQIELKSDYLISEEGIIPVELTTELPIRYSNWLTGIKFKPLFIDDENVVKELEPYIIEGIQHDIYNQRVEKFEPGKEDGIRLRNRYSWKNSTKTEYYIPVECDAIPSNAALYVDVYGNAYNKEIYLGRYLVTNGMLDLTQFIVFNPDLKYYNSAKESNKRVVTGGEHLKGGRSISFDFNSYDFPLVGDSDRALRDYVYEISNDPEVIDYSVSVYVSNSPEGSMKYNKELGQRRLSAVEKYLYSLGVYHEKITSSVSDEAWDQLIEAIHCADLENKNSIVGIINNVPDPDKREEAIRSLYPSDYKIIVNSIYPQLRKGKISFVTTYRGDQGVKYEYIYDQDNKNRVNTFRVVPDSELDIRNLNDSMLDAVRIGDFLLAEEIADEIQNLNADDNVRFNKAVIYTQTGRYDEAKALFKSITSIPAAKYNLGLLQMKAREYRDAEVSLDGFADINGAIAKLYTGKNREALDILLLLNKSGERDYLLALTYNRLGKEAEAKRYLSESLSQTPSLRLRAKSEPDFNRFSDDKDFQLMVK